MKKTVKILSIIAGALLLGNTLLMSVIANFNIGLLPVAGLGAVLFAYGIFFDKLPYKKLIGAVIAFGLVVILSFGSFLAGYGGRDTADYNEETVIVLGCGIRGERVSVGLAKRLNKAAEYHEKNPDAMIIVSGGQGPQEDIPDYPVTIFVSKEGYLKKIKTQKKKRLESILVRNKPIYNYMQGAKEILQ